MPSLLYAVAHIVPWFFLCRKLLLLLGRKQTIVNRLDCGAKSAPLRPIWLAGSRGGAPANREKGEQELVAKGRKNGAKKKRKIRKEGKG